MRLTVLSLVASLAALLTAPSAEAGILFGRCRSHHGGGGCGVASSMSYSSSACSGVAIQQGCNSCNQSAMIADGQQGFAYGQQWGGQIIPQYSYNQFPQQWTGQPQFTPQPIQMPQVGIQSGYQGQPLILQSQGQIQTGNYQIEPGPQPGTYILRPINSSQLNQPRSTTPNGQGTTPGQAPRVTNPPGSSAPGPGLNDRP